MTDRRKYGRLHSGKILVEDQIGPMIAWIPTSKHLALRWLAVCICELVHARGSVKIESSTYTVVEASAHVVGAFGHML